MTMPASPMKQKYSRLLDNVKNLSADARTFYAPHLVAETPKWHRSSRRVMFVGQETRGWWCYNPNGPELCLLGDVLNTPEAVDLLLDGYRTFDFGNNAGLTNAPFWKFFHRLSSDPDCEVLWSNLIKVAAPRELTGKKSNSILYCSETVRNEVLSWQHGILLDEIRAFDATHVIFVTGPLYDQFIESEFKHCRFSEAPDVRFRKRQLALLSSPEVNVPMMRTYHPAFLSRKRLFDEMLVYVNKFISYETI